MPESVIKQFPVRTISFGNIMILKMAAWFSQAKLTSQAADHNLGLCVAFMQRGNGAEGGCVHVCGRGCSCCRDREIFWLVSIQICISLVQKQHYSRMKELRVS